MFIAELTTYGQSVVSSQVTIDGIILISEYVSNINSADLSQAVLDIDACGSINRSNGSVRIIDASSNVYTVRTILFYTLSGSTKKVVAGYSQEESFLLKTSSVLNILLPFDFSVFTNGFLFATVQSGYSNAAHNTDGVLHIENPDTSTDDSYSVYSKTQVDDLISDISYTAGDGISLSNNTIKTTGIPFGICDSTSTATAFTVTVPGIYKLEDGVCCMVKNGVVTSASGFTLNVNGLGGKPCYTNLAAATRDTTIFNVSYTMLFVYDSTRVSGGCWICYRGYDANTNTIGYQLRTNSTVMTVTDTARYYKLYFTSADGNHWVPASINSTNNATTARAVNQRPIDPFGRIVYTSANTSYAAGANLAATTIWDQYAIALGYSFNVNGGDLTLTTKTPVYVKCAPQSNGSAIMDATTPIVQTLPSSADGKIYILLGVAYDAIHIELVINHPVYYHDGSGIKLWTGSVIPSKTADLVNDAGFITEDDIPTNVSAFNNDAGYLTSHQSLSSVVASAQYNSTSKKIEFYNPSGTKLNTDIDASAFIKDGMVDTVEVSGGNLVITFNTDAGKEDIEIPISDIFDASNYYTKSQVDGLIPTVNNAKLTIKKNASDTGTEFTANASTDVTCNLGLATVATSGSYSDLSNKPTIPTVNNAKLTIKKSSTDAGTEFTANASSDVTCNLGLSIVATSGSYNDLSNKPTIPADTGDLTNNAGFITSSDLPTNHVTTDTIQAITGAKTFVTKYGGGNGNDIKIAFSTNAQHYITVASSAEYNNDHISPYFHMSFIGDSGDISTYIETKATYTYDQLSDEYDLTDIVSFSELSNTWSLGSNTSMLKAIYTNKINNAFTNAISFASTETTFNREVNLVLAKDTNTYIYGGNRIPGDDYRYWWTNYDQESMSYTGISISMTEETSADSTLEILIDELSSVTPFGKLIVNTTSSSLGIGITSVTDSLKSLIESGRINTVENYVFLCFDSSNFPSNIIGVVICAELLTTSEKLMFFIPSDDLELVGYQHNPSQGPYFIVNSLGLESYSFSNDYNFNYRIIAKTSIKDYVDDKIESRIDQGVTQAEYSTYASQVGIRGANSDASYPLLFTSSVTSSPYNSTYNNIYTDTSNDLYYNPSTNTLTCTTFSSNSHISNSSTYSSQTATLSKTSPASIQFYDRTISGTPIVYNQDIIINLPKITYDRNRVTRTDYGRLVINASDQSVSSATTILSPSSVASETYFGTSLGESNSHFTSAYIDDLYVTSSGTSLLSYIQGTTVNNATNATNATNIAINIYSESISYPIVFTDTGGATYKNLAKGSATYNPSTNTLSCTTFSGSLSGNASTATTATTATYSQYIKYSTSTNYPMYASSATLLRPTANSSVDIGTSSYKYKNIYADFYNGFPIIPFGTCSSGESEDKVVTLSPVPTSLTTGMVICVQFSSTNTKSSPTLNVNSLGAKTMYRTTSSTIGTNIATSWPAGSRVLFRYSGSSWSMLSKVDYQTSTASNTNIIPSANNSYDIGSTDYKWQNLYITGGHSSRYIIIDNSGGEPTIRPDTQNYGYLGTSSADWYRIYGRQIHVGSNHVAIPPIAATTNTSLGSIQFLRVAIPANTTTGIVSAGTTLSSSSYTLMLVTASTGYSYLFFRNNTAPSGTWTTLTDMYFYNSGSSTVYTYVLAYKSA